MARRAVPLERGLVGVALLILAACRGKPLPRTDASPAVQPGEAPAPEAAAGRVEARDASVETTPLDPRTAADLEEVQHLIAEGVTAGRLARLADIVSECGGEPACQVARRMALAALRAVPDRDARLSALLRAGRAHGLEPENDPLWPELVQSLSETWAVANTALGRSRMLREKGRRPRLLLVSSLAIYAASNRGLSDLTMPQRRTLRGEFMRLYPTLPPEVQRQIDAFVARIDVNARGTL